MRIGIMCLASMGGSARIATQLAAELARRGHRVHLFARIAPFDNTIAARGVKVHTVKASCSSEAHPACLDTRWPVEESQAFLQCILDVITSEGLDVLHFHYAVPFAFVAAEIKLRLGWQAPLLIGTLHGTDVSTYGYDSVQGPALTHALRQADKLTTVSASHARLAAEVFKLPSWPEVIPNFINLSKIVPPPGNLAPMHKPRIAHISNFRPVKDTPGMTRTFLAIREQIEAELWLIGDGPDMGEVRSLLEASPYASDVKYWGICQEVTALLAQSDLLLMTSKAESFCLAALEAMACGVPVLATKVGGLPEVVQHGQTGLLFPAGSYHEGAALGVELLANPIRHGLMCLAATNQARIFSEVRVVPQYERLYQTLLYQRAATSLGLPWRRGVKAAVGYAAEVMA